MRSLEEILEELRKHPDVAHFELFTFSDVIEHYINQVEFDIPDGDYDFNNLDFNYTHLSNNHKQYITNQIEMMFESCYSDYSLSDIFGSINDLPNLKKMIMNEVKLNALLNKNKDDEN
jgi:hypothetical protein